MKGIFITFEGPDGSGKTTQLHKAAEKLRQMGYEVLESREPGGTELAEKVRSLVLDASLPLAAKTEVLLYLAARSEHVEKVLRPALAAGKIILCDRFCDSTLVYQGLVKGLSKEQLAELRRLNAYACDELIPDLTLLLDGRTEVLAERRSLRGVSDRYEDKGLEFQRQVRTGFCTLAELEPQRIRVINAEQSADKVAADVLQVIRAVLPE